MKKKLDFIIRNKIKFSYLLIFLLIFVTRFYNLEKTAFFVNDQGRDLFILYNFVSHHKFTLIGPATSFATKLGNIYFGPYYYYFLLPFFTLNNDPFFITLIFPMLFIIGCWLFLKIKDIDQIEKIIFLVLITFSSVSLYFTRFLWNLNLAFLLSFILFNLFFIYKNKILDNSVLIFIFGLISGSIFQIHYGMFFLFGGFLYIFLKNKKGKLYCLGFILSFLPFFIFDLKHQFIISKTIGLFFFSFFKKTNANNLQFIDSFRKLFNFYLIPSINLPSRIKIAFGLFFYTAILIHLVKKRSLINSFLLISFVLFLVSLIIFKRNFDYYFACFYLWFFLGLSKILKELFNRNISLSVLVFLFILSFSTFNAFDYFHRSKNAYNLYSQKLATERISREARKMNINHIRLKAYPHDDDKNGIKFLLLTKKGIKTSPLFPVSFSICFNQCNLQIKQKLIYKTKNLSVYFKKIVNK